MILIAGPCAVESETQILTAAHAVKKAGATHLRGGAWKPRTHPDSFQGLGRPALLLLEEARRQTGLPIVAEVLAVDDVMVAAASLDVIQVGTRNCYNVPLLRAVAQTGRTILFKRGYAQKLSEALASVEYIRRANPNAPIWFCERGVRTWCDHVRHMLDVAAIELVKREGLPVIVDPSHAAGHADLVVPLALAAVAVGADGLMVEVHHNPHNALSDPEQQLVPAEFEELVARLGAGKQ